MIEAMACGTPVVAFARGAAPEVVVDGETGFVVDTFREMVDAVGKVDMIDPLRCRKHVEAHFGTRRMATQYLEAYERILAAGSVPGTMSTVLHYELGGRSTPVAVGHADNTERLAAATDAD